MVEDEDEKGRDRYQRAAAAGGGAYLGAIVAGPVGIIAGAVLGPLLEPLVERVWAELPAWILVLNPDVLTAGLRA